MITNVGGPGGSPSVVFSHVAFSYSSKPVFTDLDVMFGSGLTFLLGENGTGKTTLFKILLGVAKGYTGSVSINGSAVGRSTGIDRGIGYLPQDFQYPGHVSAFELVSYLGWLRGLRRTEVADAAGAALAAVGLEQVAHTRMRDLSGGMVRRVGIAQALVHRPDLLLLDEPTVGLDPVQRVALRGLLSDLGRGTSIVCSTHLLEDAGLTDSRVVILADGGVRFRGTAVDLVAGAHDRVPARVGTSGPQASPLEAAYISLLGGSLPDTGRDGGSPVDGTLVSGSEHR